MKGAYDPALLALAPAIAWLASFATMSLVERVAGARGAAARTWLVAGALLAGGGVWATHLIGMHAFLLPIAVVLHVPTMLFSLGMAVVVWFFVLWIAGGPRQGVLRLAVAGLCTGLGLAAVHFSGLFAMQIVPAIHYDVRLAAASLAAAFVACWLTLGLASALRHGRTLRRLAGRVAAAVPCAAAICAVFYLGTQAALFEPDSYSLGVASERDTGTGLDLLVLCAAVAVLGLLVLMVLVLIDHARKIAEMSRHAGRLELASTPEEHIASQDPLTGLANRALLAQRFAGMRAAADASGRGFALLIADVDHFRAINGSLGPEIGDEVLREVAQRLGALVRPGDTVARPEGDEFALLLNDVADSEQAARIAVRVSEVLGHGMHVQDLHVQISTRVGFGLYPHDGEDVDTLMRHAHAMLQAV